MTKESLLRHCKEYNASTFEPIFNSIERPTFARLHLDTVYQAAATANTYAEHLVVWTGGF